MPARRPYAAILAIVTSSFANAWGPGLSAQSLCPKDEPPINATRIAPPPFAIAVDANFDAPHGMLPEGNWRMASPGGRAEDGLALEGVSFKRTIAPGFGSSSHAYNVTVDLRAWANKSTDLELTLVQGARQLRLGTIEKIALRCEAKSVSRTFTIEDTDFVWLFGASEAPTLKVTRTTREAEGC